jgi:hypothetical protein
MLDGKLPEFETALREFESHIGQASHDSWHENVVRMVLGHVAMNCPAALAVALGKCVVEYRRREIRDEIAGN